jgi:hypothetical protein
MVLIRRRGRGMLNIIASLRKRYYNIQIMSHQHLKGYLDEFVIMLNINGDMELYNTTDVEFQRILNEEGKVFWQVLANLRGSP